MVTKAPVRWGVAIAVAGLIALASVGGCSKSSSSNPSSPPAPADVTIEIVGIAGTNSFSPNPANVGAGKTVAWHNADSNTHDIVADDSSFNTGNIAPGNTSSPITMHTGGAFPYHCSIHPSMTGTMVVAK